MQNDFIRRCREWQRQNPDWELLCDLDDTGSDLYTQWSDLSTKERMYWVGTYRDEAKDAFEEFGLKTCKVPVKVLDVNMKMHSLEHWPHGHAMTIYKTKVDGVPQDTN